MLAAVEDQFLFGTGLMIAPILKYKVRERKVYLPSSCSWTHVWENETHNGGQFIDVDVPLNRIPVFVRSSNESLIDLFKSYLHTLQSLPHPQL